MQYRNKLTAFMESLRRRIRMNRLQTRIGVLFGAVTLIPASLIAFFSILFFSLGVQTWFSDTVKQAVQNSQAVAEAYLKEHQKTVQADILGMANDLNAQAGYLMADQAGLEKFVRLQSFLRNFSDVILFEKQGGIILKTGLNPILSPNVIAQSALVSVDDPNSTALILDNEKDHVGAIVNLGNFNSAYLYASRPIDPIVVSRVENAVSAANKYQDLENDLTNLKMKIIITYLGVTLLLVIVSIYSGLRIARRLLRPTEDLMKASQKIRGGDYSINIQKRYGVREFDSLNLSFKRMATRIEEQRADLQVKANIMETILSGVQSGVLSIGFDLKVQTVNQAACTLLDEQKNNIIGRNIGSIFPKSFSEEELKNSSKTVYLESYIYKKDNSFQREFIVKIAPVAIYSEDVDTPFLILSFEDVTELKRAQEQAAWSDVARKVAHEIKNPLTPIQLSAERLNRRLLEHVDGKNKNILKDSTNTIIRQVADIKALVDEFATFARLPKAQKDRLDIVECLKSVIGFYQQAYETIKFNIFLNEDILHVDGDQQMLRQVFTNIIQNSVDALKNQNDREKIIQASIYKLHNNLYIQFEDSGPGLPKNVDPSDLLKPYVTHKAHGTGLGLAIVRKILNDHSGNITFTKLEKGINTPDLGGACTVIQLPLFSDKIHLEHGKQRAS